MRADEDHSARAGGEVAHGDRRVVRVEGEALDPLVAVVGVEVGVAKGRGEHGIGVPDAAHRADAAEAGAAHGRAGRADVDGGRVGAGEGGDSRRAAAVLVVDDRPRVEETGDGGGDLHRGVARVRPRRRAESVLLDEFAEIEKGAVAAVAAVERIRRVEVLNVGVVVAGLGVDAFVGRPAEVQAGAMADVEILPVVPADIAEVDAARLPLLRVMFASARPQGHAAGRLEAHRPDARTRRARRGIIIERIAGQAVTGRGIDADDFSVQRIDQLAAVGADVLRRADDAVGQRLRVIGAGAAADVGDGTARAVATTGQQSAIGAEQNRADAVLAADQWKTVGERLPDQHKATGRINRPEPVTGPCREARDAADGGDVGFSLA